ncbi:protein of unknown function [Arthrobacter crystallopoietes]|uniref:DUF4383 domain-containing protein n=1 Tax=Crystallibacter crystallopoietes TaxID=37928 RepID=A0A1H1B398_9MICC|nr:DUF4383 domain-containing protein [Arthrobacter crystallopoietes]AUI51296.1 hypothetical protein AC20117_11265 [Arthrobacter crystallopoietes]SDQ46362.1 protein of unknown function [Arthrobacter crystallopoietes]
MTTASPSAHHAHVSRGNVRNAAMGSGIVLIVLGVLGFIPGITMAYDQLAFAAGSEAMLFNAFQISMLLNIVYIVVGAAGWAMSRTATGAKDFLLGAGALYLAMWIYGLIINLESAANFLSFNMATNWLHFIVGVVLAGLGVAYMVRHRGDTRMNT